MKTISLKDLNKTKINTIAHHYEKDLSLDLTTQVWIQELCELIDEKLIDELGQAKTIIPCTLCGKKEAGWVCAECASKPLDKVGETKLGIVSGDLSRDFWEDINSIDAMSSGDDIHKVLYFIGCKMQELEAEIEELIDGKNKN